MYVIIHRLLYISMGQFCCALHGLKPVIVMMSVQAQAAALNVLYKLAIEDGINLMVLVVYRLIFATGFMVPLALILERKTRPKLTRMILLQAFLTGLFGGFLPLNLGMRGLALTSATFSSAMANLNPVITFILSIPFGLETLGIGTAAGKAKVLGTCLGIGGAMLLTFYKGLEINIWETNVNLLDLVRRKDQTSTVTHHGSDNSVLGALFCLGASSSSAVWLIIQTKMSKTFPCHYSSSAMMCVMAMIQAVIFTVCMERHKSEWKLNNAIRLITASYSGIVAFGLTAVMISWCAHKRGPLFVSNFKPLSAIIVAIAANLLLDEKLHLGSVLGAILIIFGIYVMAWGKSKEMKEKNVNNEPFPPQTSQGSETLETRRSSNNVSITVDGDGEDRVMQST